MNSERVYAIGDRGATPLNAVTLAEAGLKERQDLQEWVIAQPEILGPDIRIVTFEFDRWEDAQGDRQRDRLDVLGIDADGRLVLAELKRDLAPPTVEMQAVKYAAMASRFTEEQLVRFHARHLSQRGDRAITEEEARTALVDHAGDLDAEVLRQPRIVLVAGSYNASTTATIVWLTEMGLDITLQRIQAYRMGSDGIVITVSQILPVPDVEDFAVSPQRAESVQIRARKRGKRERSTVVRLVEASAIPDGEVLELRPTTEVDAEARDLIEEWVATDPRRGRAIWHNDRSKPLQWEYDGERYRPSTIVQRILRDAVTIERNPRGPAWWVRQDGTALHELASTLDAHGFDWSVLHAILEKVPEGRWTTYGDLAQIVGTAAMPLGGHVGSCTICPNTYRVLDSAGAPRSGFHWTDPSRTETQREALETDGVRFVAERADSAQRMSMPELQSFADALSQVDEQPIVEG